MDTVRSVLSHIAFQWNGLMVSMGYTNFALLKVEESLKKESPKKEYKIHSDIF